MQSKVENRRILTRSLYIGIVLSLIMFGSNWLVLVHQGEVPSAFRLFDISFYYFTPLLSWIILTAIAIRLVDRYGISREFIRANFIWLVVVVLLLSPFVRIFDILVDFTIKNLLGMISVSPFKVLNDVWLVVLFSTPTALLKITIIGFLVYFFKHKRTISKSITLRSSEGGYHVLVKDSISYLQSDGNYLNISVGGTNFRTRDTLKSIESKLGNNFFRIHKSTIINWNHIRQLKHWRNGEYLVVMADAKPLTSSKTYKRTMDEIKKLLMSSPGVIDDPNTATVHPTVA